MSYQFPDDLEERLKARLATDKYQTEDDVIRDALDALDELEQEKLHRWHEGNRIAIQQSRMGLSKPLDEDKLIAEVTAELAKEGIVE